MLSNHVTTHKDLPMARRFRPQSTPGENVRIVARSVPWKLLLLIPVLVALAIPT